MPPDIFGNLSRGNNVIAKLEELGSLKSLDEHQIGMARILRFRQNPSLIDATLKHTLRIEKASDILIAEVLNVLAARDLPVSTRALAAGALGHLIHCRPADAISDFDMDTVIESMSCILSRADSPVLKKALFKALDLARSRK